MRSLFALPASAVLVFCLLAPPAAHAQAAPDPLTLTLTSPDQAGVAGSIFTFAGTLSNPTAGTVFLNGGTPTLNGPLSVTTDSSPFDSAPISLAPAGMAGNAYTGDFFSVTAGASTAPGTYFGFFTVQGGADGNVADELASTPFSVTVLAQPAAVPEASTTISFGLLLALGGLLIVVKRRADSERRPR